MTRPEAAAEAAGPQARMILAVAVLVRNEADIFPAFAQHAAALFDHALFLDHGSTDGTTAQIEAACASRPGWARWLVDVPGLYQAAFTTFAMRHLFATTKADAVVLLDADEFIDVPDRATLHAAIGAAAGPRDVPSLAWVNAVTLPLDAGPLRIGAPLLVAPSPSPFLKAVITRALFDATAGRVALLTGNHVVDPGDGQTLRYQTVGTILHLPLRSLEQMRRKTVAGALGHLARTDRVAHEGAHRFDGLRRLRQDDLTGEDVLGWAASYGEPDAAGRRASWEDLRRAGFTERRLDVAHAPAGVQPAASPAPSPAPSPWAFIASQLLAWRPAPASGLELWLDGAVLRARPAPAAASSLGEGVDVAALQAECRALRQEAVILRASTSWRLTAPLRGLARLLSFKKRR